MDHEELAFNAWILVGNVLNTALRGANTTPASPDRNVLQCLDSILESVKPGEMLQALQALSPCDRHSLVRTCVTAQDAAGADAEAVLGLPQQDIEQVITFLQKQH